MACENRSYDDIEKRHICMIDGHALDEEDCVSYGLRDCEKYEEDN